MVRAREAGSTVFLLFGVFSGSRFLFVKLLVLASCAQAFVPPALSPAARWSPFNAHQRGVRGICPAQCSSFVWSLHPRPAISPALTRPGLVGGVLGIRASWFSGDTPDPEIGDRGLTVDYERRTDGGGRGRVGTAPEGLGVDYERPEGWTKKKAETAPEVEHDLNPRSREVERDMNPRFHEVEHDMNPSFNEVEHDMNPRFHVKGVKKVRGMALGYSFPATYSFLANGKDSSGKKPQGVKYPEKEVKRKAGTAARLKRKWQDQLEEERTG